MVEDNVCWFQIPINNVSLVQIFEGKNYLRNVESCSVFRETVVSLKRSFHVTSRSVIEQKE